MENTTYIGLSRLSTMRREMDVIANNMANMNTNGYKGERVLFEEYLKGPAFGEKTSFVTDVGMLRDTRVGKIQETGNTLDIAINGTGYMSVDTPQGRRYTRDGHLRMDADRRLVTSGGHPVLDDRGREIVMPAGSQDAPSIATDGTVTVGQQQLGKIDLVSFANQQELRKTAQGLYATTQTPEAAPSTSTLQQGALEDSNVEPITEMSSMIELMRQYQSTQDLLDSEDSRVRNAIQRLGKSA